MRNAIVFINICIVAAVTLLLLDLESLPETPASQGKKDRVAVSHTTSLPDAVAGTSLASLARKKASATTLSDKDALYVNEFINEMIQLRIYHREQARLASQRGTSRPLKDFGAWMILNQQLMLDDLDKLARRYGVQTTKTLNADFAAGLSDLNNLHGKKFDSRYMKAMMAEHKNDLKRLERATYSQVAGIQVFATRYMSITRHNFDKIQEIRRRR